MTKRDEIAELFKRHHRDACYPDAMDFEALSFADAVLDALREPTPETIEAGYEWTGDRHKAKRAFQAMIDVAHGETK